jgi:SnoaL-like protein
VTTPADYVELRGLADLYAIAIDRRDGDTLRGLFTPDARIEVFQDEAEQPNVVIAGPVEIGAVVDALRIYRRTFHFIGNFVCDVDQDSGSGITYCIAHHWVGEDGRSESETLLLTYDDTFERTDEGWRFSARSIRRSWAEFRPVQERLLAIDRKLAGNG